MAQTSDECQFGGLPSVLQSLLDFSITSPGKHFSKMSRCLFAQLWKLRDRGFTSVRVVASQQMSEMLDLLFHVIADHVLLRCTLRHDYISGDQ